MDGTHCSDKPIPNKLTEARQLIDGVCSELTNSARQYANPCIQTVDYTYSSAVDGISSCKNNIFLVSYFMINLSFEPRVNQIAKTEFFSHKEYSLSQSVSYMVSDPHSPSQLLLFIIYHVETPLLLQHISCLILQDPEKTVSYHS